MNERPQAELDAEVKSVGQTAVREVHLTDLTKVVLHRWRLVVLLAGLAAGGAYLSARDAIDQYQSFLTVQVSSRKQVFARMDDIDVDELALRTDPVLSEALVLKTQQLALRVVNEPHLQLRLEMSDPSTFRGDYFYSIVVEVEAPRGYYVLQQTGPPGSYVLLDENTGTELWSGTQESVVEGPGFSLQLAQPDLPNEGIRFRVVTADEAAAWVRGGISYSVVSQTNAVSIRFTSTDRTLVPHVLNQTALELQRDGKNRALGTAHQRVRYIENELEQRDHELQDKLRELQAFKETQQITNLTAEEQGIVESIRMLERQRQDVLIQISALLDASETADALGVEVLNRLAALDGTANNTAVLYQIENLLQLYENRRTLTAGALGLRQDNPQVGALDQRIKSGHDALASAVRASLESLDQREASLEDEIETLRSTLMTYPGKETRIAQLEIERDILQDTYSYLLGQHQQAQLQAATISHYVEILDGASPPGRIGTGLRDKVILGMLVGLLLGLGGAFFLEYLDQTIKSAADVERVMGVPVLGLVPLEASFASKTNGTPGPVVAITNLAPDHPSVEAFRSLRTNVTFVAAERPIQFLAVTSPGPGEGKSTTTVNLAVALAQSTSKVLLVDGDLRRPVVHRTFKLISEPGLTDILVGKATIQETIRTDVAPNLDVIPSGPRPPNPSELLGSNAMQQFIAEARRDYDFIVIDTPPTLPVTDSAVIGAAADAMIVVVRSSETEEQAAQRALAQLRRVHTRVAGVVLNGVSRRHERYYSYYSYGAAGDGSRKERSAGKSLKSRLTKLF
jgi:tyrosine-protein kinase Etk/Wzc